MTYSTLGKNLLNFTMEKLVGAEPGHDVDHARRVLTHALNIMGDTPCDRAVVMAAAILHDVADHKFFDESRAISEVKQLLADNGFSCAQIDQVVEIITHLSFSKEIKGITTTLTPEFCIVQDADRLDALGAIGIARAFSYGGYRQRPFNAQTEPSTIAHFHEKLLKLSAMMKTQAGRQLAEEREAFMRQFLKQFDHECTLATQKEANKPSIDK